MEASFYAETIRILERTRDTFFVIAEACDLKKRKDKILFYSCLRGAMIIDFFILMYEKGVLSEDKMKEYLEEFLKSNDLYDCKLLRKYFENSWLRKSRDLNYIA